jgi:hypothetical protein
MRGEVSTSIQPLAGCGCQCCHGRGPTADISDSLPHQNHRTGLAQRLRDRSPVRHVAATLRHLGQARVELAHQRAHQLGGAHIGWRAGAVGFVAQALALLDLKALREQVGELYREDVERFGYRFGE